MAEWAMESLPKGTLVSLFFGGGTPSLIDADLLVRIIDAIKVRVGDVAGVEVTVETNPGTVTPQKLDRLREGGVNRLSIGAQALQNYHLINLNRIHDVTAIAETVKMARASGFSNISLDAIYGLPEQTLGEWHETIEGLLAMRPEHLSLYALMVEPGTPLKTQVERGEKVLPDSEIVAEMADWAEQQLAGQGLYSYEISNYARPGYESRHNRLYWRLEPYVALGSGAHAYAPLRRWWNVRGVRRYMDLVEQHIDPEDDHEMLTSADEMREFLWLGLRQREGVSRERFTARFEADLRTVFFSTLRDLKQRQLIVDDGERIFLTDRGRDVANVVARALVDAPIEEVREGSERGK